MSNFADWYPRLKCTSLQINLHQACPQQQSYRAYSLLLFFHKIHDESGAQTPKDDEFHSKVVIKLCDLLVQLSTKPFYAIP